MASRRPQRKADHKPSGRRADQESSDGPPERLIVMGQVSAPFGIKGWVKLESYAAEPKNLLAYPVWWIGSEAGWQQCRVEAAQVQGRSVLAKLAGCEDRDAAAAWRGREVAVPREALPEPGANEFYWADLIGLKVFNLAGEDFGVVSRVIETGANDVLVVQGDRERLIPFTAEVVREVDVAAAVVRVDWAADY